MRVVCLVLAGTVVGQNLKRLSQVRILVLLLLLSGLAAAAFTGWQYTYGVGVQVRHICRRLTCIAPACAPAISSRPSMAALCMLRIN